MQTFRKFLKDWHHINEICTYCQFIFPVICTGLHSLEHRRKLLQDPILHYYHRTQGEYHKLIPLLGPSSKANSHDDRICKPRMMSKVTGPIL